MFSGLALQHAFALLTQELYESFSGDGYACKRHISRHRKRVAANFFLGEKRVAC